MVLSPLGRSLVLRPRQAPVDLRKGYNGLYGLVQTGLGRDPLSGELYLFVNLSRRLCKVLVWDGTGLCIFQKRLEKGAFASLWRNDGQVVRLTASELALFIEGCTLVGKLKLPRFGGHPKTGVFDAEEATPTHAVSA